MREIKKSPLSNTTVIIVSDKMFQWMQKPLDKTWGQTNYQHSCKVSISPKKKFINYMGENSNITTKKKKKKKTF